jgi:4-amino-4-deoxy-L-arabinose transferase-like glycosyltransferase
MPRTTVLRPASTVAALAAALLLGAALCGMAATARAADTSAKNDHDTTVNIKAFPPSITVDATAEDNDEASDEKATTRHGNAHIRIDTDEDFDPFSESVHKNPWIIGLIFLVVGSIFLTPVVLLIGIIWYKLRKTRLQNEAMLRLAEAGVVSPAQAVDALATSAPPSAAAPQLYQQAVMLRKRVAWSDLRKGVILLMIGLAFLLYWLTARGEPSWVGLILVFVGIGYLALWWLEGRHFAQANAGSAGSGGGQRPDAMRGSNGGAAGSSGG